MLIQEGPDDIVYDFVFAVCDVKGEGADKSEEREHGELAAYLDQLD